MIAPGKRGQRCVAHVRAKLCSEAQPMRVRFVRPVVGQTMGWR
jgi:hypothetical protein